MKFRIFGFRTPYALVVLANKKLILLSVMSLKRKYGKKFKALWIPYYVTLLWSDLSSKLIIAVVEARSQV